MVMSVVTKDSFASGCYHRGLRARWYQCQDYAQNQRTQKCTGMLLPGAPTYVHLTLAVSCIIYYNYGRAVMREGL